MIDYEEFKSTFEQLTNEYLPLSDRMMAIEMIQLDEDEIKNYLTCCLEEGNKCTTLINSFSVILEVNPDNIHLLTELAKLHQAHGLTDDHSVHTLVSRVRDKKGKEEFAKVLEAHGFQDAMRVQKAREEKAVAERDKAAAKVQQSEQRYEKACQRREQAAAEREEAAQAVKQSAAKVQQSQAKLDRSKADLQETADSIQRKKAHIAALEAEADLEQQKLNQSLNKIAKIRQEKEEDLLKMNQEIAKFSKGSTKEEQRGLQSQKRSESPKKKFFGLFGSKKNGQNTNQPQQAALKA